MNDQGLILVVLTLATFRLSVLLVDEYGLFGIAERWRTLIGVVAGLHNSEQPNALAGIFSCVWCCSLWVGLGFTLLYAADPTIAFWLALPFALSAFSVLAYRLIES